MNTNNNYSEWTQPQNPMRVMCVREARRQPLMRSEARRSKTQNPPMSPRILQQACGAWSRCCRLTTACNHSHITTVVGLNQEQFRVVGNSVATGSGRYLRHARCPAAELYHPMIRVVVELNGRNTVGMFKQECGVCVWQCSQTWNVCSGELVTLSKSAGEACYSPPYCMKNKVRGRGYGEGYEMVNEGGIQVPQPACVS